MKSRFAAYVILVLMMFTMGHSAQRLVLAEYFTNAG